MTTPRRIALALVCALGASALAGTTAIADPLLSGYSGPGGGEQVVLGSKLLPPRGGGGGGGGTSGGSALRATAVRTSPAPQPKVAEPSTPASSKPATTAPARHRAARSHPSRRPAAKAPAGPTPDDARGGPNPAAPSVIPYPSRASSAGGLPLSQSDIVLVALGAGALILVALALRRLAPGEEATR
jgi:hypothetical protein